MDKKKFYITTAIAYTSAKPHIGNTYEIILTDAIARFKRYIGDDVFFLTGTDEHGQKIQEKAEAAGVSPKEFVDNIAGQIKDIADMLNVSYDKFIRTTDDYHVDSVQKIFKKLYDQGDIYKSEYEGLYCTPCESFWTETQLKDGKCPDCGREVKKTKEEAYFFKMSKYQDKLMKYIEENPEFIQPESRKKEMVNNFLKPGLQDLCVSRTSFSWGIPVSFDEKHVIYAEDLVRHFGVDAVRYYSLHEMPFAQDGTITYDVFISRYNSDLANTLGNLVNRTVAMTNKYFDGVISKDGVEDSFDADLIATIKDAKEKIIKKMETWHIADSMDEIWRIVDRANKYIDETMPWVLAKSEEDKPRLMRVLYNLLETIRTIASLLSSFMPETSEKIVEQIGAKDISFESINEFGGLADGTKVGDATPLFARIDAEKKIEEIEAEFETEEKIQIAPYKDYIEFDDFLKLDIRVGKVIECEKVKKSDKLLRFTLEVGSETRQILSGIAKFHEPEELIGKNVLFIANLKPRKMMGLESSGMILSAEFEDSLTVLTTLKDIQSGAEIV